ncbi:MAG: AAA family ATPase [Candidatus Paceibacterota bacterium]|jgi:ATP-dependent exoDNAse (exonuclease V) alpha subunit
MTQKEALEILKMGYNCYITGAAGSGKTHLLNEYVKFLKQKGVDVGITASTGIAATHMGGTTIHSWSGLGIRDELTEYDLEDLESKKYIYERFKNTTVLIIDEISMLHHFRLDLIERIARHLKRNQLPFGGMQVILCGDFFQLPPVSRMGEKESHFSYKSEAWKKLDLKICYLEEQYRQKDAKFLKILNDIRRNCISDETRECLKSRHNKVLDCAIEPTKLHTHNINVDTINDSELNKLKGEMVTYTMESKGRKPLVEALKKSCLASELLRLKVGTKVMFVKNNFEQGYANGTLGKVIECSVFGPKVMLLSGKIINVEKVTWMVEEEGKVKAQLTQYPLRLAWAITVHKSQGMSLDAVEVDLSKSFERGMGYVALSRVRTLEGLRILGLNETALKVRDDVMEFDEELKEMSGEDKRWFNSLDDKEIKERQNRFLEKVAPPEGTPINKKKKSRISPIQETKNMLEQGMGMKEILEIKGIKIGTILDHIEKILKENPDLDISHLKSEVPAGKFKKAWMAFRELYSENRDYLLAPVRNKLGDGFTYEELRIVRLFVKKS